MKWNHLNSLEDWKNAVKRSYETTILVFKHSTRCNISSTAKDRLERKWESEEIVHPEPYLLHLIEHRDVSNTIAHEMNVEHESPQVILIQEGKAYFHVSHYEIEYMDILMANPVG